MSLSEKKVDVIIPTYNSMPWLEQTLDSVLRQTHHNIEIYVIDDGSTDKTEEMMTAVRDPRVHYLKKKNGGVSSARNYGVRNSSSEFVAFLDADDIWMPEKISKQLEVLCSDPSIGMVYGHHNIIDEDNAIIGSLRLSDRGKLFDKLVNGNIIAGSASMVLVRRSIIAKAGEFREDFTNGEDWFMWLKISLLCQIDLVPEIIASIRVHPGGAQQQAIKMADALVYAYSVMKEELDLTNSQQRLLASYCLFNPMVTYENLGDHSKALETMFYLFKENPPAKKDFVHWKLHFSAGIFGRIITSHPIFTPFRAFLLLLRKVSVFVRRSTLYIPRKLVSIFRRIYRRI